MEIWQSFNAKFEKKEGNLVEGRERKLQCQVERRRFGITSMPRRKRGRFNKTSTLKREKGGFSRWERESFNTKKRKIGRFGRTSMPGKERGSEIQ
jgi:hypothetical protein